MKRPEPGGTGDKALKLFRSVGWQLRLRAVAIVYALLPFKGQALFSLFLRRKRGEDDFNNLFFMFCRPKLGRYLQWFSSGPHSKKYASEIMYLLSICEYDKLVIASFQKFDWSERRDFFVNRVVALIERFSSGYAMDIVVRLHQVKWTEPPSRINSALSVLVRRMLEHRLFDYEQRMIAGRRADNQLPHFLPTETFVPYFYRNKQLIKDVSRELGFSQTDTILRELDDEGQSWEEFPDLDSDREVIRDVHLFYAYRDLTLYSYHNGEGQLVKPLSDRTYEVQQRLRHSLPTPSPALRELLASLGIENLADVKLLWPDWAALIGHNGHLNVHFMMRQMGWWTGKPIVLAWKERIANPTFLSLFEDICPVLVLGENVSSAVWHELASLIPFLGVSHQTFRFADGNSMYWNDAGGLAVLEWEKENRGFPLRDIYDRRLQKNQAPATRFAALRRKWGMGPDDWHVCLHMRDGATRGEKDGIGETIRNTSLDNYLESVQEVVARGGWVIRMGGPKVPPLPPMDRVIDYARTGDASPEMDIHLMRTARMFIGTTSGFAYVASSFGIPTAMVNALSSVGLIWSGDTRFSLKPVRTTEGRLLTQREVTSDRWRWAFPTHEALKNAGLVVEESSADEILETVKEILDLVLGEQVVIDTELMGAWERSVEIRGFYGAARPSAYFLRKYASEFLSDA